MNKLFPIVFVLLCFGFSQDKYLAVMNLEPIGLSSQESNILTERLTNMLVCIGKYKIIERSNIDKIIDEQKFQYSGCTDTECAIEIGRILNSNYIVIGSVSKLGSTYSIDSRMIDIETSEIISSASYSHKGDIDKLLNKGITKVAKQMYLIDQIPKDCSDKVKITHKSNNKELTDEFVDEDVKIFRLILELIVTFFRRNE